MIVKIIGNLNNIEDVNFNLYLEEFYNPENENREIWGLLKYFSDKDSKTNRHLVIFDNEEEFIKCRDDNNYFNKQLELFRNK